LIHSITINNYDRDFIQEDNGNLYYAYQNKII